MDGQDTQGDQNPLNQYGNAPSSILNEKDVGVSALDFRNLYDIPPNFLEYTRVQSDSRGYTVVVSLSGKKGTYNDIQAALTFIHQMKGGRVLILPGTYVIGKNLTIYSDTVLEGVSYNSCLVNFNGNNNLSTDTDATNVVIRQLQFYNSTNSSTGALNLVSPTIIRIQDCQFQLNVYDIYANGASQMVIDNCISSASTGFFQGTSLAGANTIRNCEILNTSGRAIVTADQTSVDGCYIATSGSACVYGNPGYASFENNYMVTNGTVDAAIDLQNTNPVRFKNNYIALTGAGAQPVARFGTCNDVTFNDNMVASGTATANTLSFNTCQANSITSNKVYRPTVANNGLQLAASNYNQILGNFIQGGSTGASYGITLDASSGTNTMVGNVTFGNTGHISNSGVGNVDSANA